VRRSRLRPLALASLLLLAAAPAGAQRKDDQLHTEQRKLQQTRKQLKEERDRAEDARRRESSVLAELEEVSRRLADKQREVTRLDARVRKVQGDIAVLRSEIGRLEGSRSGQEEALARRLRTLYKVHAQGGALPLILSGDDPVARAIAVRQLATLAALDARLIQEYRVTSDKLVDRRAREEGRKRELAEVRAEAAREQAEVDADAARRRVLLAKVRDERAYHERMVGELTESSRRLETFIRDLQAKQRQLARVPHARPSPPAAPGGAGFGSLRGRLPWPTDGRIVSAFGAQVHPRFGTRTFRSGVDIEAAEGTDIGAVAGGQVVYTGWFKGYGNLIILDHGGEFFTLYAHVAEISVKEGDEVRAGQKIGSVGDTGSLAGPRLYFEVRHQGKPQDPEQWLRQRS
jgi:septal ring factor EnvC (AmiA/AmiB activator)